MDTLKEKANAGAAVIISLQYLIKYIPETNLEGNPTTVEGLLSEVKTAGEAIVLLETLCQFSKTNCRLPIVSKTITQLRALGRASRLFV